ncbi:MAG TPA: ABC-type transport auxiliary lipoprotein family protein [Zoogloea sp.]|uniref:ABC-type transport auxiliary lipoprotein family protein n=1 Tax=Zoogloea sp. TaxID=49181 RepID=UPI001B41389F|nr:ABC-type transport auxiliary lipoprotein family protein [Zoogloea sp.]MBP8267761.1 membrane integrity-associated transporter subunit PqiC [Zoogloea sp.]HOB44546.1 ABC-type transport auxiliary lipoprotein family protein [Zoogloea sp.]HQA08812.1 ABC-type transport auxiliary lipoprotein family protein [Zoogloea sp.]HQE39585.1 ABC-type transport auxiliary lipoprotein family protein [Zoogloea sp.]
MARTLLSRILPAAICLFGLGACGSVPKAAPGYAVHDFGPLSEASARPLAFSLRTAEVVPAPWLASTGMQYRLAYAQPTRRLVFVENRWAAQPGQLVELAIKRGMKAGDSALATTGCRLRVDLDEFVQVFDSEGVSRGVVEARAFLLAPRSDQLIATRSFSATHPAPSPNAVGGVVALREGVEQLERELFGWLDALAAERAARPSDSLRSRCGA